MDNNMGFHKERSAVRPQTNHPEIKTDGSMLDFILTSFYSICSRSVLVLIRGVFSTLNDFMVKIFSTPSNANNVLSGFISNNLNVTLSVTNTNLFTTLVFNFFHNIFNTLVYTINLFDLTNFFTNLTRNFSYLFSLEP